MSSLLYSINIVIPVVLLIVLGYLLRQWGQFDERFIEVGARFSFNCAIPASLFNGIYQNGMGESWDFGLLFFCVLTIVAWAFILLAIVPRFICDGKQAASMVQGMFRSNFVLIGLPLVMIAFGEVGASLVSLVMPFCVTMFNVLAVVAFTSLVPAQEPGALWRRQCTSIAKNPLVISCIVSIVVLLIGIRLPKVIESTVAFVGQMATPLALLVLGGQIDLHAGVAQGKKAFITAFFRCAVIPAITLFLALLFGFRGARLMVVFVLFAAPTAVSSFVMSKQMGGDVQLSADIVALSTLLSAFTLTAGIALMKAMQWI